MAISESLEPTAVRYIASFRSVAFSQPASNHSVKLTKKAINFGWLIQSVDAMDCKSTLVDCLDPGAAEHHRCGWFRCPGFDH